MKWLKHDSDANQDAKLQNVLLDYGLEGYGLYWYCIELIANRVDVDCITFELEHDARIIARNTGSTPQKVEEMMRYFVKLGLFEDSTGVITCIKLARRLDKSMTSNPQMREIIGKLKNHDSIMTESAKVMQDKIRLDKNKDISPSIDAPPKEKIDFKAVATIYNDTFPELKKVRLSLINDKRKRAITKLFKFTGMDLIKWQNYLNAILTKESCQWMLQERSNQATGQTWRAKDFDYFITENCYIKVREG